MLMGSDPKLIHRIERFLKKVNRAARLDEIQFHKVLISTTEAVNNAIIHGNKKDPRKKVLVRCELSNVKLVISVRDEGKGFDPSIVPNPIADGNVLKEAGRGIFLMKTLMDKVEFHFSPQGFEVVMTLLLHKENL